MYTQTKCLSCTEELLNQQVEVRGFVAKTRNLGGMLFIDLRDRTGIVQLVIAPENKNYDEAKSIRNEYVIAVQGTIVERQSKNPNMVTGAIEIIADTIEIVSRAKTTPLIIAEETDAQEEVRLKYRYLDLRRPNMQNRLIQRHKVNKIIHNYMDKQEFIEVETPMLSKSTPEGARDYLIPSRIHEGEFYALPQSPQQYKQLLMLSGIEKYYQIVRCFRDEDLRVDRQPEFTQFDVEQAFAKEEDMYTLIEGLLKEIFFEIKGLSIDTPFPMMTHTEAMNRYGSDKPDTRFEMEIIDLTQLAKTTEFGVFANAETVRAIVVPNGAAFSRKEIDGLTDFVKIYKAKGLAWMKVNEAGVLEGPITKFFTPEQQEAFLAQTKALPGSIMLFVADATAIAQVALGQLRIHVAKKLDMIDPEKFSFLWVVDWPLFEYDEKEGRYSAAHHPFTAPKVGQESLLLTDLKAEIQARAYDIVVNGYELGGGSVRIHNPEVQEMMFKAIGLSEEVIQEQFGFLLEAYSYGAPIHAGIALGVDRLMMILTNTNIISDVIAFPKTLAARDLMMNAPVKITDQQLSDVHIKVVEKPVK